MSKARFDDFVSYYQRELAYLAQAGSEFSERYPKIARRLNLRGSEDKDPHVERLIESFAFLTARIHERLDDDFPELSNALLSVLYPHYTVPIPSMSIASFEPDWAKSEKMANYIIPSGTLLTAVAHQGISCRFQTVYPIHLQPVRVAAAEITSSDEIPIAPAYIRLVLDTAQNAPNVATIKLYLHGQKITTGQVYDAVMAGSTALYIKNGDEIYSLPPGSIAAVGFDESETMLPRNPLMLPQYTLLHEFFSFQDKYYFLELRNLAGIRLSASTEIWIPLREMPKRALPITAETFKTNCTPIVNIFRQNTEPIRITHRETEYRLLPDLRAGATKEIYSILAVYGTNSKGEVREYKPFYSYNRTHDNQFYWFARREQSLRENTFGSDVYLSLRDIRFSPADIADESAYAVTLCTNRDLPVQIPAGAALRMDIEAPLRSIALLNKPTMPIEPPAKGEALWRTVAHVSLDRIPLGNTSAHLEALQQHLLLYAETTTDASLKKHITAITEMKVTKVMRHIGNDAWRGFCRGYHIEVTLDENEFIGASVLLFGKMLQTYFTLSTAVNSFVEMTLYSKQRREPITSWKPMAGVHPLQ